MAKHSRTGYSIINMAASLGGYALNILLSFVCRIVFVRQLNAEYLGINGLFSNILSMLSLAELGVGTAMIYALYRPVAEDDREKIASYMRAYGTAYKVIGGVIAVLGVLLIPFLNLLIKDPPNIPENITVLYLIFLFSTVSSYFYSYRSSILIAHQENYIVLAISYGVVILQNLAQILALLLLKDYMVYLILQVVFVFVTNILISFAAKKRYPYIADKNAEKLSKTEVRSLSKNIKALTITKLSGILVNNTDNIIITYFGGLITVGYASNYILLSSTLNTLLNQVFNSMNASVANFNAVKGNKDKLELFNELNLVNFWLFGWAAIGIFVISSDIVGLLFGQEYVMEIQIPLVIAVNFYIMGMQATVWTFKNTLGLFRPGRYLLLLTATINLLCSIWWGNLWGLFGIYLATAASRLLTNVWYDPYAVFKYGFREKVWSYYKKYGEYSAILAATAAICYFLCSGIQISALANVVLKFMICCIVPNLIFFLCFRRRKEFQYFKKRLLRVIHK